MMKRFTSVCVLVAVVSVPLSAVGGNKAQYVGGTITQVAEKVEGKLDTSHDTILTFAPDGKKYKPVSIQYSQIRELEYGQKAGRRVAVAVFVSPLALFSKKRNHYLTISYVDDQGKEQAGVFELGKDIVRTSLAVLQTRSGKTINYQDEDARKSGMGGK